MIKTLNANKLSNVIGGSNPVGKVWFTTTCGWASGIAAKRKFPGAFLNNAFYVTNTNN